MNSENNSVNEILRGKTAEVYSYLLKHSPTGIRDIQKGLQLASPSSVSYHINKLVDAGIVGQNKEGKYLIVKEVETDIKKFLDTLFLRFTGYSSYFATVALIFLVILLLQGRLPFLIELLFLIFAIIGLGIFIFELYNIQKKRTEFNP
jgi:DNA-binding transcriptional ArsR family regulator